MIDTKPLEARQQAVVNGDPAALLLHPHARTSVQHERAVRVSSESVRLERFWARVYLNKVGETVVSVRIDRWKHGMQVWENPTNASVERLRCLIREQRGW